MTTSAQDQTQDYLERTGRLAPLVAQHRESFDRERRIPQIVFDALADAGLFRLWLPKALGGPELPPVDFMTVVEAAAALDGSVGWIVGNGGGMSRCGGYLPEATARAFFADGRAFIASSTGAVGAALPVDGGFRVTGRWPFGSGSHHATQFMVLASVKAADGTDGQPFSCYLAHNEVAIHDSWHVSGLRGTGSCEFEARDVFVPVARTHGFLSPEPTQPGLLYRLPGISAFGWTVAVVPLGIARGVIDAFKELALRKTRAGTTSLMRDRDIVQVTLGRAETLHAAARSLLADAMGELMAATTVGGGRLVQARVKLRTAAAHATETALRVADMLTAEAGGVAIFETSPLERAVRDLNAAAKHIALGPNNYLVAGRISLGVDPGTVRF